MWVVSNPHNNNSYSVRGCFSLSCSKQTLDAVSRLISGYRVIFASVLINITFTLIHYVDCVYSLITKNIGCYTKRRYYPISLLRKLYLIRMMKTLGNLVFSIRGIMMATCRGTNRNQLIFNNLTMRELCMSKVSGMTYLAYLLL